MASVGSLFVYRRSSMLAYFLVYVDDLLTGNDPKFINYFKVSLANKFSLKDLGSPSHCLGIELVPTPDGLFLTQHHYIRDLLHKHNMHDAKPVCTPMSASVNLATPSGDVHEYRQIVGSLQYLALTRPNVAYCVSKVSQFMHAPTTIHMQATKGLLRYLKSIGLWSPSPPLIGSSPNGLL
ncbi:hypothetical protein JHK86_004585 [Glycine max]|nr:hypothetical protein JHK86_004585 [Glycine max]